MRHKLRKLVNLLFILLISGTVIHCLYGAYMLFSQPVSNDDKLIYALAIIAAPIMAMYALGSEALLWWSARYWVSYPGGRPVELTASILQFITSAAGLWSLTIIDRNDSFMLYAFCMQCLFLCVFWIARIVKLVTNRKQVATVNDTKTKVLHTVFVGLFVLTFLILLREIVQLHQRPISWFPQPGNASVYKRTKELFVFFGLHLFLRELFLYQGIAIVASRSSTKKIEFITGILQGTLSACVITYAFYTLVANINPTSTNHTFLTHSLICQFLLQCVIWGTKFVLI